MGKKVITAHAATNPPRHLGWLEEPLLRRWWCWLVGVGGVGWLVLVVMLVLVVFPRSRWPRVQSARDRQ